MDERLDDIHWPAAWPRVLDSALGAPPAGSYRQRPEDFLVEESLDFAPQGEGEHLWLFIEKRDQTTAMVARELARLCEVSPRDVGYSGMKDRVAVTRQWLSVQLPGRQAPEALIERLGERGIQVLDQGRHPRKLKRGVHRTNRFSLRITGEAVGDSGFDVRWQRLCHEGVANYFGPQRFGPDGRNLQRARALLARGWRKRDDRDGMLLSAARSFLFNELLAERVRHESWNQVLPGEVVMLEGSASQFTAEVADEEIQARAARHDLHPTGVLWGTGTSVAVGEAQACERALAQGYPGLCAGLERAGVRMARRALRLRLIEPTLESGEDELWLSFSLPRGAFATSVLRELIAHPSL
ncbi:tRNA pseudouridine(13) synthase TruD [Halomonas urumqiensis]|uniref:tRNA pseudouridine synthase D n=1 Tax=Halomonas urumqiensis TaxID=1684789 RepID=A0A2N7UHP6_9GAMM|nr:tRNA pseudouridine(13) synthase TruD [Halomonas urumqiensis]PMR79978.1 tRNA pseudouridine(13) synthase TruD [Halomonas urumqiensis]PTB02422.1 tRNA pseudouridine(13) synthase TruD [Halomonas urumqiensis]